MVADGAVVSASFFTQSSFGNYALAEERNVVRLPEEVDPSIMGPMGCGLQTGAGAVLNVFKAEADSTLVVLGGGTVGLAAVMAGVISDCAHVIVVEPHASRRDLAVELGATETIDPSSGDLTQQILDILPDGADYIFDTTGHVEVMQSALDAAAGLGQLGMVGLPADFSVELPVNIVDAMLRGLSVTGIVEGDADPQEFVPRLVEYFKNGRFPFDKLVQKYPLSKINEAVQAQLSGEAVKVVLTPDL